MIRPAWTPREVPTDLAARYVREGWWTDETVGTAVESGLAKIAATPFVVHSDVRPWRGAFGEIDQAARRFATTLRARGVKPGGVVMFQLPNWVEAAIAFWGAAYAGAVVVPVVHFYGPKELDYILRVVAPDVIVSPDRFGKTEHLHMYDALLATHGERPWFVVGSTGAGALPRGAEPLEAGLDCEPVAGPAPVDPDAPAVLAFTSGTTKDPKGVIHSSRTILCEMEHLLDMSESDNLPPLIGTPVGHFMGMTAALLGPLRRHKPLHLIDVWDPATVIRTCREENLSIAGGAPYFVTSVLDHPDWTEEDNSRIGLIGLGGATVPTTVTARLKRIGAIAYRSYGSTEHPSITASNRTTAEDKRLHTDGMPLEGVEMRLDDEGQIYSRGPDLCLGYTDSELTASAFDADGWYRTGDVGVVDGDGYLTITDRVSDIIIRGGENISAQEVEEQLLGLDGIAEAYVVAAPDARMGEHAAAVITPRPGHDVPSLAQLREHLAAAGLAKQKWPESIYDVRDLPRTASGKVQKFKLRDMVRAGELTPTDTARPRDGAPS